MKKKMEKADLTEKNTLFWDFPGGPVLQTWCFHYRGDPFHPTLRSLTPHGTAKKTNRKTVVSWSFLASFLFSFYYLRKY